MVRVPRLGRGNIDAQRGTRLRVLPGLIAGVAATAVALVLLAPAGCAKTVKQGAKTGEDGKSDGAVEVTLANNEGIAKGIVTYPGGDRVDWKTFELPKDKVGTLTIKLSWVPPRPGLDLSVAVLNQWNHVVAETKPNPRRSRKKLKTLTIENAKGKYFLQVYAQKRSDAGRYTVTVAFTENIVGDTFDWLKESIADPPKLPAVPPPPVECTPTSFDKKNPACITICPSPPDPAWPPCAGACPVPPDPAIPKCLETMPCPAGAPDRKFKMCKPEDFPPCKPSMTADERKKNPNCDKYCPPDVIADVTNKAPDGDNTNLTIGAGKADGVDKGWTGELIDDSDRGIKGTKFVVTVATNQASVAKVKVSTSSIPESARARLSAPCPHR